MKIGIDCRLWSETGVGRYIRNLVKNLQDVDRGNEYTLFVLSKDHESIKHEVLSIKEKKWRLAKTDIRWHTLKEQLILSSVINKENLDLMHFPYISVPIFYNKPFVVTIHDLIINHFPTGQASTLPYPIYNLKRLGYKFVISQAAKKAKKIIAVSNATKQEIIDHLGIDSNKIAITYEAVDEKVSSSRYKVLNMKDPYFLYVGSAYPHKNLDRLLEAQNILISQYPNISLIFVGKQDYFYKRLKEKTKNLGLEKSVRFLGEIIDDGLGSLYKNAKALVIPSLMEGFGLPALEAMANKCLVLASNIPSLREVCGDTALYFDPYNLKDMEKKMREVCFNDLNHFSEKIKKGLERAKFFSWQKMARETLKVYDSSVCSESW